MAKTETKSNVQNELLQKLLDQLRNGQMTPEGQKALLDQADAALAAPITLEYDADNGKLSVKGLRKQPFGMQIDEWETFQKWTTKNPTAIQEFIDKVKAQNAEAAAKAAPAAK